MITESIIGCVQGTRVGYAVDMNGHGGGIPAKFKTKVECTIMTQKDAVFAAVSKVLGRSEFSEKVKLEKAQRAKIIDGLVTLFDKGKLVLENKQDDVRIYAGGLLSNWLRKDPRLNGNKKHIPVAGQIGRPRTKAATVAPPKQAKSTKQAKPTKSVNGNGHMNGRGSKMEQVQALYGNDREMRAMLAFLAAIPAGSDDVKIVEAMIERRVQQLKTKDSGGRIQDVDINALPKELRVIAESYKHTNG